MTSSEQTHPFGAEPHGAGETVQREHDSFDLDRVYRLHAPDVSRWIRRLAGRDDVSDLLHEVFVVAQKKSADFRGDASVRTWLYAIAMRVVSSWRRKQRLRRLFFPEPVRNESVPEAIDPKTPFSEVASKRATAAVNQVLERLSERDRTLIVMFELEGMSAAEIQEVLGISANGV